MKYTETEIPGVFVIEPDLHTDNRGYFMETFRQDEFNTKIAEINFVQDNESSSCRCVVRGLHFQRAPYSQSKLVRCIMGRVLDVVVDLRKGSPTFGKSLSVELSSDNKRQLFIPKGMAHGFAVLSDKATFVYKCDAYYHPESEDGINPFDSSLKIDWHIDPQDAIMSEKDLNRPTIAESLERINFTF